MTPTPKTSILCLAAALALAGCAQAPTAPTSAAGAGAHAAALAVPDFSNTRLRYADGVLRLEAAPETPWTSAPFGPDRDGGWCFQLFLNTDQLGTGYGPGVDYLVRAVEVGLGGGVDVRRAVGGGGPGGWGEAVGRVALRTRAGALECTIPLEILGPDDGAVDFVLEVYRTIEKPAELGGGVWHEFVANYSGTSSTYRRDGALVRRGTTPLAPGASRIE